MEGGIKTGTKTTGDDISDGTILSSSAYMTSTTTRDLISYRDRSLMLDPFS